jgi:hypothetical protein
MAALPARPGVADAAILPGSLLRTIRFPLFAFPPSVRLAAISCPLSSVLCFPFSAS